MSIDLNRTLDLSDLTPEEELMLTDLQSHIVKDHGRPQAAHYFLRFVPDRAADARKFIHELAAEVTSARKQLDDNARFKATGISGGPFVVFALSAAGYKALKLKERYVPKDIAFRIGMKGRANELGDDGQQMWDVHALLLVADQTREQVIEVYNRLLARPLCEGIIVEPEPTEWANKFTRSVGLKGSDDKPNGSVEARPIEHFGYVDGISVPQIITTDASDKWTQDVQPWEFQPLSATLVDCPGGVRGLSFGSYLVFRKLEQNVRGFKITESKLGCDLGLEAAGEDKELAGAWLVGRFEDGTPVERHGTAVGSKENDFVYEAGADPSEEPGKCCPMHAHIRKVNPRKGEFVPLIRRGVTYGDRTDDPTDDEVPDEARPAEGVGLLFMCYQASIENQFEAVQKIVNGIDLPVAGSGLDPVLARLPLEPPTTFRFPSKWQGVAAQREGTFNSFVTLKGGEYFFAPSISFLRTL